jgi:hypothetical protein
MQAEFVKANFAYSEIQQKRRLLQEERLLEARSIATYARDEDATYQHPALFQQIDTRHPSVKHAIESGSHKFEMMLGPKREQEVRHFYQQEGRQGMRTLVREMPQTDWSYGSRRSYFDSAKQMNGKMMIHPQRLSDGDIIHEYGHFLEMTSSDLQAKRAAFLQRRAGTETPSPLGGHYSSYEVAVRDKFKEPYIGKIYKEGDASEVISMGMQLLFDDPVKLARDDPSLFDFITTVLREK